MGPALGSGLGMGPALGSGLGMGLCVCFYKEPYKETGISGVSFKRGSTVHVYVKVVQL